MSAHRRSVIGCPWINSHLCSMLGSSLQTDTRHRGKPTLMKPVFLTVQYPTPFLKIRLCARLISCWHTGVFAQRGQISSRENTEANQKKTGWCKINKLRLGGLIPKGSWMELHFLILSPPNQAEDCVYKACRFQEKSPPKKGKCFPSTCEWVSEVFLLHFIKTRAKAGKSDSLLASQFSRGTTRMSPSPLWVDFTPTPCTKITSVCQMSVCRPGATFSLHKYLAESTAVFLSSGRASAHFNAECLWGNKDLYVSNLWKRANSKYFSHLTSNVQQQNKHWSWLCARNTRLYFMEEAAGREVHQVILITIRVYQCHVICSLSLPPCSRASLFHPSKFGAAMQQSSYYVLFPERRPLRRKFIISFSRGCWLHSSSSLTLAKLTAALCLKWDHFTVHDLTAQGTKIVPHLKKEFLIDHYQTVQNG